jgi:hypothetical protein
LNLWSFFVAWNSCTIHIIFDDVMCGCWHHFSSRGYKELRRWVVSPILIFRFQMMDSKSLRTSCSGKNINMLVDFYFC